MSASTQMMSIRKAAFDRLAELPTADRPTFEEIHVAITEHLPASADPTAAVPTSLTRAVVDLLVRDGGDIGPGVGQGAAVVTGLLEHFDLTAARTFHSRLFSAVWDWFRDRTHRTGDFRVKVGSINDGAIPEELYGSRWSFKRLHVDRDALLFSHLYGPVSGFAGGNLVLVDIRPYLRRRSLSFSDAFEWSDEPTEGCKPVLRRQHEETASSECGVDLGALGPDAIVFVNNEPAAGVLHGVTPVTVTDPSTFRREYHRCSVKEVGRC